MFLQLSLYYCAAGELFQHRGEELTFGPLFSSRGFLGVVLNDSSTVWIVPHRSDPIHAFAVGLLGRRVPVRSGHVHPLCEQREICQHPLIHQGRAEKREGAVPVLPVSLVALGKVLEGGIAAVTACEPSPGTWGSAL